MSDDSDCVPEHERRTIRGVWQPRHVEPKDNISPFEPAPKGRLVRCFIAKDPISKAFFLFLQLTPQLSFTNKGKFLLAARENSHVSKREFSVWNDPDGVSEDGEYLVGKMLSNLSRSDYVLYDLRQCQNLANSSGCLRGPQGVPPGSVKVLEVKYHVSLGKPQQFKTLIYTITPSHATPSGQLKFIRAPDPKDQTSGKIFPAESDTEDVEPPKAHNAESKDREGTVMDKSATWPREEQLELQKKVSHSKSEVALSRKELSSSDLQHRGKESPKEEPSKRNGGDFLTLKTKAYEWDESRKIYYATFSGRDNIVLASSKNFQLAVANECQQKTSEIFLQFGEANSDLHFMDYTYPLTAFEAFGICLPRLD
ncbi:hypothetical protein R1sor_025518 [Riccia sorocarpa]|uniref:Tubby C-terminal domain-containing protein n=1 Tax=Riccia sorocarpa TaxID=122646 RepID=A0ABD3G8V4_9MARC